MRLRSQLLLVTALVLLVPVAGWQFVKALEQSLRQAHEQALVDSATSMARTLAAEQADQWAGPADGLYVHSAGHGFHLDGHDAEWEPWLDQARTLEPASEAMTAELVLAGHRDILHLLLSVDDRELVFADPDGRPGDHVEISVGRAGNDSRVVLAPLAPGWVEAVSQDGRARVQGNWQPRRGGWTLELQVAAPSRPDHLAVTVHDVDSRASREIIGSVSTGPSRPLVRRNPVIERHFQRQLPDNTRGWALTEAGWVLAYQDQREPATRAATPSPILFERLLGGRLPARPALGRHDARLDDVPESGATWMSTGDGSGVVVVATAPVELDGRVVGRIALERSADQFLVLANQAVLRLFGTSLAGLILIAAVLIGFAALLSERIRRLRNRTEAAVLPDGRVIEPIAAPRSADEIGDLGRSMADLINRQYSHQHYLRTLADKLAHELRTPLATIRSSLDNLAQVDHAQDRERYRQRAEAACQRLGAILQSMSQAARVEEALDSEPLVALDLGSFLDDYVAGCAITFDNRHFELHAEDSDGLTVRGAPDLLAQLLDKLIDNAVDFSPPGSTIDLRRFRRDLHVVIQVDNQGPAIPASIARTLFDSMVSHRSNRDGRVHLGLGLYIARLIARHHGGSLHAAGLRHGSRFELRLPALDA